MFRHAVSALFVLALLAGTLFRAAPAGATLTGPALEAPAPDFQLTTVEGRHVRLSDYRGKTLVLNVWGSWCPPCRLETPDLVLESRALEHKGVVFLGVDTTETAAVVRAFAAAKNVSYPQVATTADSAFAKAYDIRNYPTTFVIDPQGIVRARHADNLLPRPQLHAYIVAAQAGRTALLTSAFQRRLDTMLDPAAFPFTGDRAAIVASAVNAARAIAQTDDLDDNAMDDASRDHDLLRTQEEQAKLRDRAIAALEPVVSSDAERGLLARLRGDQAVALGSWTTAQTAFAAAVALDPTDLAALAGQRAVAANAGDAARVAAIAGRIATIAPSSSSFTALARADAALGARDAAYAALEAGFPLAKTPAAAARAHLSAARIAVRLNDSNRARKEFAAASDAAAAIAKNDPAYVWYIEQAQEGTIALSIRSGARPALSVAPWTGADLPGSIVSTTKYRVAVTGAPGGNVTLIAAGLPKRWISSWCTDRVCAPFRTTVVIPAAGVKIVEFQVVPDDGAHANQHPVVRLEAHGSAGVATASVSG